MAMDNDPHSSEWYAILLAGGATAIATIWKGIFNFRKDLQTDKGGSARSTVIEELQGEVERLSAASEALSKRLDEEVALRRAVQTENHGLRLRITALERQLEGA